MPIVVAHAEVSLYTPHFAVLLLFFCAAAASFFSCHLVLRALELNGLVPALKAARSILDIYVAKCVVIVVKCVVLTFYCSDVVLVASSFHRFESVDSSFGPSLLSL